MFCNDNNGLTLKSLIIHYEGSYVGSNYTCLLFFLNCSYSYQSNVNNIFNKALTCLLRYVLYYILKRGGGKFLI